MSVILALCLLAIRSILKFAEHSTSGRTDQFVSKVLTVLTVELSVRVVRTGRSLLMVKVGVSKPCRGWESEACHTLSWRFLLDSNTIPVMLCWKVLGVNSVITGKMRSRFLVVIESRTKPVWKDPTRLGWNNHLGWEFNSIAGCSDHATFVILVYTTNTETG